MRYVGCRPRTDGPGSGWKRSAGCRARVTVRPVSREAQTSGPLVAFSWAPFRDRHTRVAGGYSLTLEIPMDPEPLQMPATVVPMPWDSPDWFLGLAYAPLP